MIYDKASLVQIPSGYKSGTLYSVVPNTADGDFDFTRGSTATRVNKDGLIETVASGVPRLDYPLLDGVVQDCPTLLLEPQRTNSITYSEDFSDSSWNKNNATVTSNNTTAPDGTTNADKITSTGTAPYARVTFTHSTLTSYAVSIFAKKGDEDYLYIRALALSNQPIASFNLSTGNLGTVNSGLTAEMQNYGNGWYRCVIKYTTTSSITNNLIDFGFASSDNSRFSSSGKFTYFWGAQIETGSYPTSYIPTTSAVTRTVDTVKLENFTDMPTDYPFTAFVDMDVIEDEKGYGFSILDISSSSRYWSVGYSEDSGNLGKFRFTNRAQGTSYSFNTTSTYGTGRYKVAVKFISATNFKAFIDGVEVADYTHASSAFNTNINDVLLGQLRVAGDVNTRNTVYKFMLFNEALSDSELEEITSYDSFNQMAKALLYTIE